MSIFSCLWHTSCCGIRNCFVSASEFWRTVYCKLEIHTTIFSSGLEGTGFPGFSHFPNVPPLKIVNIVKGHGMEFYIFVLRGNGDFELYATVADWVQKSVLLVHYSTSYKLSIISKSLAMYTMLIFKSCTGNEQLMFLVKTACVPDLGRRQYNWLSPQPRYLPVPNTNKLRSVKLKHFLGFPVVWVILADRVRISHWIDTVYQHSTKSIDSSAVVRRKVVSNLILSQFLILTFSVNKVAVNQNVHSQLDQQLG